MSTHDESEKILSGFEKLITTLFDSLNFIKKNISMKV